MYANQRQRINQRPKAYNQGMTEDQVAWSRHAAYYPPKRDYGYDTSLSGVSGQPPFAPLLSKLYHWRELAY